MKKLFGLLMVTAMLTLALSSTVMALPDHNSVEVSLTASAVTVKAGEAVSLSASADKQGSAYADNWSGATKCTTVLTEEGNYVSSAEFKADSAGIYTVTYDIVMGAGKSGLTFTGTSSLTITVEEPLTVKNVEVRNITAAPRTDSLGKVSGYSAVGDIYIIWSDGSATCYGKMFFNFGPDQVSRNIFVTIYLDGKAYTYSVCVARPV